jgi:hypothetical protein
MGWSCPTIRRDPTRALHFALADTLSGAVHRAIIAAPKAKTRALLAIEETAMTPDIAIALLACDPRIIEPHDTPNSVTLRFQIVDQTPNGPQRSGKYAHLGVTIRDAMKLLVYLQTLAAQRKLRVEAETVVIEVPPAKDRN